MKVTIIHDNTAWDKNLTCDWGFSCLVEAHGKIILFDTGAKGNVLLDNMRKLDIDPLKIDVVFISHDHWDHTGGLLDFLEKNQVKVYIPVSCIGTGNAVNIKRVDDRLKIYENIYSTGELKNIEHSLVIKKGEDVTVIAGCSHPGVREILRAASDFGKVNTLIGGLHGFNDFELINDLENICPTHCTRSIQAIETLYPGKYINGGAGKVIEI
uniref:MBL fold metallo-hydrolase n=1 Tax=Candidatus Desulfatibia profunda TaxID=2841695 RepID=A0A8J6NNV5_9BACT|nr:MBL fold metallo-hydrolase [Candidatus Desulfatibia profunda]